MNTNWKEMGFATEKEYTDFLNTKVKELIDMIKANPKLLDVFKRLYDR